MIVLVGASASGKTELAKLLFKIYGYTKCITTTTREPRANEENDIDYHFLTMEEFEQLKTEEAFLENSLYNGNYYGFQKRDVKHKGVVVVDPNGANSIIKNSDQKVFVVYIKTSEDTRMKRMISRGDDLKLAEKRIDNDRSVFIKENIDRIDLMIENETQDLNKIAAYIHNKYLSYMGE